MKYTNPVFLTPWDILVAKMRKHTQKNPNYFCLNPWSPMAKIKWRTSLMRAALFLRLKRTAPSWITKAKRNNEKIKTLTAVRGSKSLTKLKSILHSLLIENLQAGIRRALLMFAVLIRLCAGFRVTLARLQKAHKTNLGPPPLSPPLFPLLFFVITRWHYPLH